MDFAKFVQLIESQALWFPRADQFPDPLEGTLTDAELDHLRSLPEIPVRPVRSVAETSLLRQRLIRTSTFVSCWRSGDGESLAMWDLYGKGSGIVAVKSSVGLLKTELASFHGPVYIARVDYIDWRTALPDNHAYAMCARKDSSYEHESEVRAIILEWEAPSSSASASSVLAGSSAAKVPWQERTANDPPLGLQVAIVLREMITEVVVGPRERPWVAELVKSVMTRYGLGQPITVSNRLTPR